MYVLCTADTLKDTIKELKANGYKWVCRDIATEQIIKSLPTNTKYIMINATYNHFLGLKEMTYQSERWFKENEQI
jgi:hypothetical protein